MRKFQLGAAVSHDRNSTPRFSLKSRIHKAASPKGSDRKTMVMSWFPSWKGDGRMVPLRSYSLIPMATLLEADPEIESWSVAGEDPVLHRGADRGIGDFNFLASQGTTKYVYRLHRSSADAPGWEETIPAKGYRNVLVDMAALARDPRLPTARTILYHRLTELPDDFRLNAFNELLDDDRPKTLGDLQARCADKTDFGWRCVIALVGLGHVIIRLGATLDMATPILGCRVEGYQG